MKHKVVATNEHHFYPTANPQPAAGIIVSKEGGVWSWAAWLIDIDRKPHIVARGKMTTPSGLHPHVAVAREGFAALEHHLKTLVTAIDRARKNDVQDL